MDEDLKDKIDALEKENRYLKKLLRENNIDFEYPTYNTYGCFMLLLEN